MIETLSTVSNCFVVIMNKTTKAWFSYVGKIPDDGDFAVSWQSQTFRYWIEMSVKSAMAKLGHGQSPPYQFLSASFY